MVTRKTTVVTSKKEVRRKKYMTRVKRTFRRQGQSLINAPIRFKRTVTSKDFQFVNVSNTGGMTVDIGSANGLFFCTVPATQGIYYASVAQAFALKDDPNRAELTAICEKYKLTGVKVRLIPAWNSVNAENISNKQNSDMTGWIHSVIDYDDYVAATATDTGINALRQYANYKMTSATKGLSRFIRPKMAQPVYRDGVSSAYMPTTAKYIDEIYDDVEHYGLKFVIEILNPSSDIRTMAFKWENTYYFTLKDRR